MTSNNFFYLLAGLLFLLVVEPFLEGLPKSDALIQLAFASVLVVGVFSLARNRRAFQLGLVLAVLAVVAALGYWRTDSVTIRFIDLVAIACFYVLAIVVTMRQVLFGSGTVTLNQLAGALCSYLLLGVLWAVLYTLVEIVEPTAFKYPSPEASDTLEQFLYYSFVTLTTLGYGDIIPVHPVARTLSYLEAVIGQLYIAVLIAGLVGRHIAGRGSETRS